MSLIEANTFDGRLLRGERILWTDRPAQGLLLTARDGFLIPFSLFWCGFAIFWEMQVLANSRAPVFFRLFGVPFVLVGLYLVLGRFLVDIWARRSIVYALTDQRVLILRRWPSLNFTAIGLERLPDMNLKEDGNGRGTIRFGPAQAWGTSHNGSGGWTAALDPIPQFLAIGDVRGVFNRIQDASRAKSR